MDNICVYGDSFHNYLIGLVVPNAKSLQALAAQLGKKMSHAELCNDADINSEIMNAIKQHGIKAKLSKIEIPAKIKVCSEEWLPDTGLVTAAFKLRRKNIQSFYQKDINKLYGKDNGVSAKSS